MCNVTITYNVKEFDNENDKHTCLELSNLNTTNFAMQVYCEINNINKYKDKNSTSRPAGILSRPMRPTPMAVNIGC